MNDQQAMDTLKEYVNAVKLMRAQPREFKAKWLDKVDQLALDIVDLVEAERLSYNIVMMALEGGIDNVL